MARRTKQKIEPFGGNQLSLQFANGSPLCIGLPGEIHEQRFQDRKQDRRDEAWDDPAFCMAYNDSDVTELDKEKDNK